MNEFLVINHEKKKRFECPIERTQSQLPENPKMIMKKKFKNENLSQLKSEWRSLLDDNHEITIDIV
jgi:hypothetical protein